MGAGESNLDADDVSMYVLVDRLDDGSWKVALDGQEVLGDSLEEAVRALFPDAPPDLLAHLALRDSGDWSCDIPTAAADDDADDGVGDP